jgi:hypothetical protein
MTYKYILDMFPTLPQFNSPNPLNVLEQNGYNVNSFTYPVDLGNDPGEPHCIVFYINESGNTQYTTAPASNSAVPVNSAGGPASATLQINNQQSNQTNYSKQNISRVSTVITMYIPPAVQASYATDWDNVGLGVPGAILKDITSSNPSLSRAVKEISISVAAAFAKDAVDFATNSVSESLGTEVIGGVSMIARAAINPHLEMIFKGINFREFQFDFKFTPRSPQEAQTALNIIQCFKFYSAPEIKTGADDARYYIYPAEFDIEFWSNGRPNTAINKISTCACTSVNINWTGSGGWSSFRTGAINGAPVEVNLSLQFKELEIMTKNRIGQNF